MPDSRQLGFSNVLTEFDFLALSLRALGLVLLTNYPVTIKTLLDLLPYELWNLSYRDTNQVICRLDHITHSIIKIVLHSLRSLCEAFQQNQNHY